MGSGDILTQAKYYSKSKFTFATIGLRISLLTQIQVLIM